MQMKVWRLIIGNISYFWFIKKNLGLVQAPKQECRNIKIKLPKYTLLKVGGTQNKTRFKDFFSWAGPVRTY